MNSKYVTSYHIEQTVSGIVRLVINTKAKNPFFHRYNRCEFLIGEDEDHHEFFSFDEQSLFMQPGVAYHGTETINKDQITILYIPIPMLKTKQEQRVDRINNIV